MGGLVNGGVVRRDGELATKVKVYILFDTLNDAQAPLWGPCRAAAKGLSIGREVRR